MPSYFSNIKTWLVFVIMIWLRNKLNSGTYKFLEVLFFSQIDVESSWMTATCWIWIAFYLQKSENIFSQIISSLWRNNKIRFQTKDDAIASPDGTVREWFEPRRTNTLKQISSKWKGSSSEGHLQGVSQFKKILLQNSEIE